ncbi:MAG: hemolysin III family protein [Clostridia bacterium]|nr:hemolysin III family protein [Clostridia bacterium]
MEGTKSIIKEEMSRKQTIGEEISNSVSHGLGAGLSVAGLILAIIKASAKSGTIGVVSAAIYGASLILLYVFSCLYHALFKTKAAKIFRIFDHCSIFILIFGTYTPIVLCGIGGKTGWIIFSVILACTVLGIVFNSINLEKWDKLSLVLYVIMGWLIVFSFKSVLALGKHAVILLVAGGLLYTIGIIFYKIEKVKYFHFIWHLFVLGGSLLHFFCIYFYVY